MLRRWQTMQRQVYKVALVSMLSFIALTGCQSTGRTVNSGPLLVGPGSAPALGTEERHYNYRSNVYLDVVVPVFNPGLPLDNKGQVDYDEIEEENIWPQLRRAEAKRFAIQTKRALEDTGAFGNVRVTPTPATTGDVFVLGTVDYSDSEVVQLTALVMDSRGKVWGKRQFEHTVSTGFFRDALNKDKNPYEPVFKQVASYVYDLLVKRSDADKRGIQEMTNVRYANYYSPEKFQKYIQTKRVRKSGNIPEHYEYSLLNVPHENDAMLKRIDALRVQENMFVDGLQDQYDAFEASTHDSYRMWQKETLPEAKAAREAQSARTTNQVVGGLLTAAAIFGAIKSDSNLEKGLTGAAAIGALYSFREASNRNEELHIHRETIDEMGENLDIAIGPQVVEFDDKTYELSGTAEEQYEQWKAHLRKIYELEKTPNKQL